MKTTSPFANLLRQSPFKPVQEHMRVVSRCVAEMQPLFDAIIKKDREQVNALAVKIGELESEADRIEMELIRRVFESSIDGYDKIRLRDLVDHLSGVADKAEDVGDRIRLMVAKRSV